MAQGLRQNIRPMFGSGFTGLRLQVWWAVGWVWPLCEKSRSNTVRNGAYKALSKKAEGSPFA
jgi:hypothetical protein